MPKYWVKNYFALGRFPEVGQKQKTEKKEERKKERLNDGNNNGQATHAKILGQKLFRTREFPQSGSKAKNGENTPGTAGGPGGRDRKLAVKSRKTAEKITFFS